jgi:hypothetical protein
MQFLGNHLVYISGAPETLGHIIELFYPINGGGWTCFDHTNTTGVPAAYTEDEWQSPQLTSWSDVSYKHVVYLSRDKHVIEMYKGLNENTWQWWDMYEPELKAPVADPAGGLTSCVDPLFSHVFYVSTDGHVQELRYGGNFQWSREDLTTACGSPGSATALTSWVDQWNVHVAYLTRDDSSPRSGHVLELWTPGYDDPHKSAWRLHDLGEYQKDNEQKDVAARYDCRMTSWVTPGCYNVAFVSVDHALMVLSIEIPGDWKMKQLATSVLGQGAGMTSWADPYDEHIVYRNSEERLQELRRPHGGRDWTKEELTPSRKAWQGMAGSFTPTDVGYKHVYYVEIKVGSTKGTIRDLMFGLSGGPQQWDDKDVRTHDGAEPPPPLAQAPLTTWFDVPPIGGHYAVDFPSGVYARRVPAGMQILHIEAAGGRGGFGAGKAGDPGNGSCINANYPLIPGETLTMIVGRNTDNRDPGPGRSWGGKGGNAPNDPGTNGGGGGGSSAVYGSFSGLLVEAAGGGGAGGQGGVWQSGGNGGHGGLNPTDGQPGSGGTRGGKGGDPGFYGPDGTDCNPTGTGGGGGGGGGGRPQGGGGGAFNTSSGGGGGGGKSYVIESVKKSVKDGTTDSPHVRLEP